MQAAQSSSTQQFQDVVRDAVLQHAQTLLPFQELGALPQSSEPSTRTSPPGRASLHTSVSDTGIGQISQTTGKGSWHSVNSLGNRFAHRPGIVNSRIEHFEGCIQEVLGRATQPDGMQRIASLDAHLPPMEDFHALKQTLPSPHGETQRNTATSTPRAMSLPWPTHAATTEQCLSSHGQKTSESCGGSTYASMSRAGDSSEISEFSLAVAGNRTPSSLDQDSLYVNHDVSSKARSREEHQLCLTQPKPILGSQYSPLDTAATFHA